MDLTKKIVENLPLPDSGQQFVWDSSLAGFGIRLNPAGKTYIVQARVNGVSRRISLGKHGVLTLQEARKKAQKELSKMLEGKDPVIEKKRQEVHSLTLRDLGDAYIKAHPDLKESSIADINKHLKGGLSSWAKRPAINITRDKVAVRFRELTDKSPAQANQAFRILRALFNYASEVYQPAGVSLFPENPVKVLSGAKLWNKVHARSGRIPTDKIGAAWNVLQALREAPEQTTIGRSLADIVCFLILTGARWNEAAQLTWERVNLEENWWYLPDPKNRKPVKFPLSHLAREILKARPHKNEYVFPARSGDGYIVDARGVLEKVSRAVGVHLTAHDMRRTFRAVAGECQIELWKAKLLMNHRLSQDVTISHYTETEDLRYLAPEINLIGEWITQQALIAGNEKVIPLKVVNTGDEG